MRGSAVAAAMRDGGRYVYQYRARGDDGQYRWLEAIGRVDLDAEGRAVAFPGVLLDIDERRRLEAERDQAQTLLRSFVEAMPGDHRGNTRLPPGALEAGQAWPTRRLAPVSSADDIGLAPAAEFRFPAGRQALAVPAEWLPGAFQHPPAGEAPAR